MKSLSICAGLAALAISFGSDAALAASANGPHILVIDRRALIQSKLGQNIQQQLMAYNQKMQSDLGPESQALQNEQNALESAKISPAERTKRQQAFQAKQTAFQQKAHDRQSMVQGGMMAARKYFMSQVDGVVHAIMAERGAEAVLDKSTVVASMGNADVTKEALQRLDKTPSFKVQLQKPSMQDMLQMQSNAMQQQGQ